MPANVFVIIVAVAAGVVIVLQAQMVGLINQQLGPIESVFITYGSGGLLISLLLLAQRGGNFHTWRNVPWYAYSSGVLGLCIIGTIGYSVPRLGLVTTFTIIVATQFILGAFLDHYGLLGAAVRPLDLSRLVGTVVLLAGVWLVLR